MKCLGFASFGFNFDLLRNLKYSLMTILVAIKRVLSQIYSYFCKTDSILTDLKT